MTLSSRAAKLYLTCREKSKCGQGPVVRYLAGGGHQLPENPFSDEMFAAEKFMSMPVISSFWMGPRRSFLDQL